MKNTMKNYSIIRFIDCSIARRKLAVAGMAMGLAAVVWAGAPSVQLGAVAQRYPWNGTIDVGYRASDLPAAGTNATITVTANGQTYTQAVTLANGTNTVAVAALPANVKAKDAKVTLTLK